MSISSHPRVHAALVLVSLLFGAGYVAMKKILSHLTPGNWALTRAVAALVILVAIAATRRRGVPSLRTLLVFGVPALFGVVLNQILFIEGLARTTPANSAVINTAIPVFTVLIAWAMRREHLTLYRTGGITLAVAGVLFLLEVDRLGLSSETLAGDLLTVANAVSFAFFLVIARDLIRRTSPLQATLSLYVWGAAGIALWFGWDYDAAAVAALPAPVWGIMLFVILGVTITTYFLNNWALVRVESSVVAIYICLQPLFAVAFSRIFLGAAPSPRLALAAAAIIAGVVLATRPASAAARAPGPSGGRIARRVE